MSKQAGLHTYQQTSMGTCACLLAAHTGGIYRVFLRNEMTFRTRWIVHLTGLDGDGGSYQRCKHSTLVYLKSQESQQSFHSSSHPNFLPFPQSSEMALRLKSPKPICPSNG